MPSEDEREAALRRMVEFAERIGDSIQGEAEGRTGDGRPLEGYQLDHGGHDVVVATAPGWDQFAVLYQVDLGQRLAVRQAIDDHEDVPQSSGGEVAIELSGQDVEAAVGELREHVEGIDADLDAIRAEFVRTVAGVYARAGIDVGTDGALVHRFDLSAKLFPYRERFDVADFEATVQRTVTAGWIGREFLVEAYDLEALVEGGLGPGASDGHRGMFQ